MSNNLSNSTEFKVFVGNVPYNCNQEEFSNCFNQLTGYKHSEIIIRPGTTLSRGFGFIIFNNKKDADILLNARSPHDIQEGVLSKNFNKQMILKDRILRFSAYNKTDTQTNHIFAVQGEGNSMSSTFDKQQNEKVKHFLYITGLDYSFTSVQLRNFFSKYGELGLCYVNTDHTTGQSRCTAVVEYKDSKIAENLIKQRNIQCDNQMIVINPLIKKNKTERRTIITRTKINTKSQDYLAGFAAGRNVGFREALTIKAQERI